MTIDLSTPVPLRTTINYQYRYGTSTTEAFKKLYSEGGLFSVCFYLTYAAVGNVKVLWIYCRYSTILSRSSASSSPGTSLAFRWYCRKHWYPCGIGCIWNNRKPSCSLQDSCCISRRGVVSYHSHACGHLQDDHVRQHLTYLISSYDPCYGFFIHMLYAVLLCISHVCIMPHAYILGWCGTIRHVRCYYTAHLRILWYPSTHSILCDVTLWAYILFSIINCNWIHRQVEGKDGITKLMQKFKTTGPSVFFHGSLAAAAATFVGHYPWFFTYNYLGEHLPRTNDPLMKLGRSALIGFCSSAISDTCSNAIRVVKVYKQANTETISYPEAVKRVVKEDGWGGLFGRGLKTKIVANGLQGIMFSILWKYIDETLFKKEKKA